MCPHIVMALKRHPQPLKLSKYVTYTIGRLSLCGLETMNRRLTF